MKKFFKNSIGVRTEENSDEKRTDKLEENTQPVDAEFNDIEDLYGFGNFHHFQIWVVQTLVALSGAITYFHLYFMVSDPPDWGCQEEGVEQCQKQEECQGVCQDDNMICGGGNVIFNTSHQNHLDTISVELRWLCDKKLRGEGVLTVSLVGQVINSLIFGPLCDKIGRIPVLHITNIIFMVARVISFHVTHNYTAFLILTAIGTGFFPVGVRAGYTAIAEMCNEKGRRYAFISGWIWWVAGMVLLPYIAVGIQDWYYFGLATTLCNLVFIPLIPFIPESPCWLVQVGKLDRAEKIIARMRRFNGDVEIKNLKKVLEDLVEKTKGAQKNQEKIHILTLFKSKQLMLLILLMSINYTVNDYFYIAGSLNVENLAGDKFLNFALVALTELPSVFIGQFMIDRWGRRWCHFLCMVTTAVFMLAILILVTFPGTGTTVVALSIVAKTSSNVGWFIMWVQSIELFPTAFRNTGINISATISIIISMSGPFVVALGDVDLHYPYLVFVLLGVLGTVSTSILPESKNCTLPERLEDLRRMWTRKSFWSWRVWLTEDKQEEITQEKKDEKLYENNSNQRNDCVQVESIE